MIFRLQQSYSTFTSPIVAGGFNPHAVSTPQLTTYASTDSLDYQFSGRHNGLYLYFGRILRPLWFSALARELGKSQLMDSVVTSEELITGRARR